MKNSLTARKLRILLFVVMFIVAGATVGGFVYVQKNLRGYATAISKLNADAESGDQNIRTLRSVESRLDREETTSQKAASIFANNATFAEEVVAQVTKIAAASGVGITGFEYNDAQAATPANASSGTATPPAAATPQPTAAATATNGLAKKSITVTIETPIDYSKLMKFIQGIESSELKMQIASVSMTKAENNQVSTQTFSIEAYVK